MEQVKKVLVAKNDDNTLAGIVIIYEDKMIDAEVISRAATETDIDFKKIINKRLNELQVSQNQLRSISLNKFKNNYMNNVASETEEIYDVTYDYDNFKEKNITLQKVKKVGAVLGLVTVVGTTAVVSCSKQDEQEKGTVIETSIDEIDEEIISLIGKDWEFYKENAVYNAQEIHYTSIYEYAMNKNNSESWMYKVLSDEELEEYEKKYNFEGNECIFGFTAEELNSLSLRFNTYTNEEYALINGGELLDTTAIMNDSQSYSNGAIRKTIYYYLNSEDCHLGMESLFNWSEDDKGILLKYEDMLKEYKSLINDKEYKKAEAKMKEIKEDIVEYAHRSDLEINNAKSYILRTIVPACSIISNTFNYQDTITLSLYDTETDKTVEKSVTTALFDELIMRELVLGYDGCTVIGDDGKEEVIEEAFDTEKFLGNFNIDYSRYNIIISDVNHSIADKSIGGQKEKLEQANEYIESLINENAVSDAAYEGSRDTIKALLANNPDLDISSLSNVGQPSDTKYDEIKKTTFNANEIMTLINNELTNAKKYPNNIEYFVLENSNITKAIIDYKDNNGITRGKKDDVIREETTSQVPVTENKVLNEVKNGTAVIKDYEDNPEQAFEDARKDEVKDTGIPDASTPEKSDQMNNQAQQEATNISIQTQDVYNATFNYYSGTNNKTTSLTFDAGWLNSSDSRIKAAATLGKEDGENYKKLKQQEGVSGGETTIDDQYKDAVISEQPLPSENTVTEKSETTLETKTETEVKNDSTSETKTEAEAEVKNETVNDTNYVIDPDKIDAAIVGDVTFVEPSTNDTSSNSTEGFTTEEPTGYSPIISDEDMNYSNYSLADIYGVDEYSDFNENYSNDESVKIR